MVVDSSKQFRRLIHEIIEAIEDGKTCPGCNNEKELENRFLMVKGLPMQCLCAWYVEAVEKIKGN